MAGSKTTYTSPLQLGLVSAGTLFMGVLWLGGLLKEIPIALWLLCAAPLVVALIAQPFVQRPSWKYEYAAFVFFLNAMVFASVLWLALFLNQNQGFLTPTVLVASACAGGTYGGYQMAKRNHRVQVEKRSAPASSNTKETSSHITIAGRRIPASTVERIALRIQALTPLAIALGLNSAEMLSLQSVYWILSIGSLVFVSMFTLGTGGFWFQASVARQTHQRQPLRKR
jgi:hypothetical protein